MNKYLCIILPSLDMELIFFRMLKSNSFLKLFEITNSHLPLFNLGSIFSLGSFGFLISKTLL